MEEGILPWYNLGKDRLLQQQYFKKKIGPSKYLPILKSVGHRLYMKETEHIGQQKGNTPCNLKPFPPNYACTFWANYIVASLQK